MPMINCGWPGADGVGGVIVVGGGVGCDISASGVLFPANFPKATANPRPIAKILTVINTAFLFMLLLEITIAWQWAALPHAATAFIIKWQLIRKGVVFGKS